MDKVTGEARIALMSKKDLTNDLLEKVLSYMPRDKDCKSQVAHLIYKTYNFKLNSMKENLVHKILQQQGGAAESESAESESAESESAESESTHNEYYLTREFMLDDYGDYDGLDEF